MLCVTLMGGRQQKEACAEIAPDTASVFSSNAPAVTPYYITTTKILPTRTTMC